MQKQKRKEKKEDSRKQIRFRNAICPRIVCKSSYHCYYPLWYPLLLIFNKCLLNVNGGGTALVIQCFKTPCSQCRGHRFHPWSGN